MLNNIYGSTLKYDLCIGCGICKVVCPVNAIEMVENEYREINPQINDLCINCGMCIKFCPNSLEKLKSESKKITENNSISFGIDKKNKFYIGYSLEKEKRFKSASGGAVSYILERMISSKIVDFIIQVEQLVGKKGEKFYKASISRNYEEINKKRSSFYSMIDFSEVLKELKNQNKKIVITGTPCVIRGIKNLVSQNNNFKENKVFLISLPCSHNVNGQFIDFLSESLKIKNTEEFKVNLRAKDKEMKNSNNYYNLFELGNREVKINRYKSIFTDIWRNYYFSLNACLYCSDFWGYEGDISVKDAWGKWAVKEKYGVSMVVVRNLELDTLFKNGEKFYKEKITYEEVVNSQIDTVKFKQVCGISKFENKKIKLFIIGFYFKKFISNKSKEWYIKYGYEKSYRKLRKITKFFNLIEKIVNLPQKITRKLRRN